MPSWAALSTTFLKKYGTVESLVTTTCHETVVGGKQGHAPCKILLLHQSFTSIHSFIPSITFSMPVKFYGDHETDTKMI